MATITITHTPGDVEVAYGPIIATTYNSDADGVTHVLKLYNVDLDVIAELRQQPNPVGYTHFDISKILQRQLETNERLPNTSTYETADTEAYEYKIGYGYLTGNTYTEAGTTSFKRVINGTKDFYEVDYEFGDYIPVVSNNGVQMSITKRAYPLTNRTYNIVTGADITDGKPTEVGNGQEVIVIDKEYESDYTLSFLNQWNGTGLSTFNGLQGIKVYFYNGNTLQSSHDLENLISNGGGPNIANTDSTFPTGSFTVITAGTGEQADIITDNIDSDTTHYYVVGYCYSRDPAVSLVTTALYVPVRFNIDCGDGLDYDTIQVCWVNEFGFRDYFEFQKRNEYRTTSQQGTYNKLQADWATSTYAPQISDRGEKVYNNALTENYTATTRYVTDGEASYLKNLYRSNDVMVRFSDSSKWIPVVLNNNSYTEFSKRKDGYQQYQINFRLANKKQIQQQ